MRRDSEDGKSRKLKFHASPLHFRTAHIHLSSHVASHIAVVHSNYHDPLIHHINDCDNTGGSPSGLTQTSSLSTMAQESHHGLDHSRDPCPWVALSDFGGAFCMGAIGGAVWHGIKGFRNSPYNERLVGSVTAIKARVRFPTTHLSIAHI
jgi:hypothetical protein